MNFETKENSSLWIPEFDKKIINENKFQDNEENKYNFKIKWFLKENFK